MKLVKVIHTFFCLDLSEGFMAYQTDAGCHPLNVMKPIGGGLSVVLWLFG